MQAPITEAEVQPFPTKSLLSQGPCDYFSWHLGTTGTSLFPLQHCLHTAIGTVTAIITLRMNFVALRSVRVLSRCRLHRPAVRICSLARAQSTPLRAALALSYFLLRRRQAMQWTKFSSAALTNMSFSSLLSASLEQLMEEESSDADEEKM